jgi:hypothetical protein
MANLQTNLHPTKSMQPPTTKAFLFVFPLNRKVVRDLKIVTEHITDLRVSGTAYNNSFGYDADIDFILYDGKDVRPLLEGFDAMDEVYEAAIAHAEYLFTHPKTSTL